MIIIKKQISIDLYKGWCPSCHTDYAFSLDECDDIVHGYYGTNYVLTCPSCNKKNIIYREPGQKPSLYVPPHLEIECESD